MIQSNECSNCGGKLELSKDRRKLICPFCMSEFVPMETEKPAFDTENEVDPAFYKCGWNLDKLREKKNGKDFLKGFLHCVNDLCSPQKALEYAFSIIDKETFNEVATENKNRDLFQSAKDRVSSVLEPGETVFLYKNSGVFSKGKEGCVITDKRTITFDKKNVNSLPHKEVESLSLDSSLDSPSVSMNKSYKYRFGMLGYDSRATGAFAGLICLYAFEQNPELKRIELV